MVYGSTQNVNVYITFNEAQLAATKYRAMSSTAAHSNHGFSTHSPGSSKC